MKPTDEERREVAAKLRRFAKKHKGVPFFLIEEYLGLVSDEGFIAGSVFTSECVLYLADLIEPAPERTCRPTHDRDRWECDECGCVIEPGFYPKFRGNGVLHYCPNCGAKVVR